MGNKVLEFENRMARYLKVDHFVMVNSGSSANLLIFEYLPRSSDRKNDCARVMGF
jgi:dTDP-4-amino-4,6-dideoxygalactose transaminase